MAIKLGIEQCLHHKSGLVVCLENMYVCMQFQSKIFLKYELKRQGFLEIPN